MKRLFLLLLVLPQLAFATPKEQVGLTTQTQFGASTVSTLALSANSERAWLYIQNPSGVSTVLLKFGSSSTGTEGILLGTSVPYFMGPVQGDVYLKSSAGIVNTMVLEGIH